MFVKPDVCKIIAAPNIEVAMVNVADNVGNVNSTLDCMDALSKKHRCVGIEELSLLGSRRA